MDVFERVRSVIVQQFNGLEETEITMEAKFIQDLGIESLDFVELTIALEEEFDMQIPDTDVVDMRTVGEIVKYIQDHR